MARKFSQPQLIGAILAWLDDHGVAAIDQQQLNAVIAAADGIIAALDAAPAPNGGKDADSFELNPGGQFA